MGTVTGSGRLRHCFFGTYSAVVVVSFPDAASAADALAALGPPWHLGRGEPDYPSRNVVWSGSSEDLAALVTRLGPRLAVEPCHAFGCTGQVHRIDALTHSVDYGPPFSLTLDVTPAEQAPLDWHASRLADKPVRS